MRIRRRPQAQALIPSPLHHPSDPSTAPPPPANQHHGLSREEEEVEARKLGELHRPNVDLVGDDPSRPPQGNNVEGGRSRSESNPGGGGGGGGGGGAQRQGAADGHGSLENGHRDEHDWTVISAGEERLVNGVIQAMPVRSKEGMKSDGAKRRRGPAVLLEGSRCSRVNGRGWRCSQPTLVGYSLCEHHLGKGRQSRSANSGVSGGRSATGGTKLGRTESRKNATAMAMVTVAAGPDAKEPLRHIDLRSIDGPVQ